MSVSSARVVVQTDATQFLAALGEVMAALAPVLWHLALAKQRDRSREVTRRKQRRNW